MPTTPSRAASAAAVHFDSINSSRKRAGLATMTLADVANEFADVDRYPARTNGRTLRTGTNQASADALWGGIVTRLNATLPSNRTPIAAGRTSPASSAAAGRVDASVDWAGLAHQLNTEAGLKPPARSADSDAGPHRGPGIGSM
jgi:hypothetical protein